jgi:hypothetical protein
MWRWAKDESCHAWTTLALTPATPAKKAIADTIAK